jgi:nitric oxide reductase NorD protein
MSGRTRLNLEQIGQRLDQYLEVEFSFCNTKLPAVSLASLQREEQDYVLTWVQRVASTNIELAHQYVMQVPEVLRQMDRKIIEAWALHAMDRYDRSGLHAALEVIRALEQFAQQSQVSADGALLEDCIGVLLPFVHGLAGRKLEVAEAEAAYTDSETLFLPPLLAQLPSSEENFRLYKATAALLWAQTRFGTFRVPLGDVLQLQDQPQKFLALFHALETARLEACIGRELPGLYRTLGQLKAALGQDRCSAVWQQVIAPLAAPGATVQDTLRLANEHLHHLSPPAPVCYQGQLRAEQVEACMAARIAREKAGLRLALRHLLDEIKEGLTSEDQAKPRFSVRHVPDPTQPEGFRIELTLDDKPLAPPDEVKGLMTSIVQDLGDIPPDYLHPAGPGEYDPKLFQPEERDPNAVWAGTYHEEGAHLYKEWDYRRQHYRKDWCAVRERTVSPVYDDFVARALHKHSGLIKHLRKTFEAMRDEDRLLKRQVQGDGIDIDALVEALADARDGSEMSDRLFTRMHRTERNIAVLFMVDMSGSTKGWINDAERESLVLLAESLETLGDRYAIYGFSGMTRKRCELYRIKSFAERYDEDVKARISGIQPQDYTRMGFAIRHLSKLLNDVDARTRILITLSDGKPDDYDGYRGEYGVEDTRRALMEARRDGIHPYCITIDTEARDYLPHMYGAATNWSIVERVEELPRKVSDIYRRLTT